MKKIITACLAVYICFLYSAASAQTAMKTFSDTLHFYSLSYPAQFELRPVSQTTVLIISPLTSAQDKYQERLRIEISKAPDNLSADSIATMVSRQITQSLKGQLGIGTKTEHITINGYEGRKVSMSGLANGEEKVLNISQSFAIIKGVFIRISLLEAADYLLDFALGEQDPFDKIIASIKIK